MQPAPSLDEISPEMLKLGGYESVKWLKILADFMQKKESILDDWRKQLIIPLHKKDSHEVCNNYWGIALLSIPSKVLCKAILN